MVVSLFSCFFFIFFYFFYFFLFLAYENWDDISSDEIDVASEDSDSSLEQYISAKDILVTGVEGNIRGKMKTRKLLIIELKFRFIVI